jgi:gamma-glutamyl hercynylcysteine S-oxide synthase
MTLAVSTPTTDLRHVIRQELTAARTRTLALVDGLSDADQRAQHSPLMSPLVWDLAHIGNYEELWLLRAIDRRPALDPSLDDLYNAFEHPRWARPDLPILGPAEARAYLTRVRDAVFALLDHIDLDDTSPLLAGGFVYGMVAQHEHQHDETMLATHQLRLERATGVPGAVAAPASSAPPSSSEVLIDGGPVTLGTDTDLWAYDNERPAHVVTVPPFHLDTTPVTNRAYLEFMADGGYRDARWWTDDGWRWRHDEGAEHPLFWHDDGGSWSVLRFGRRLPLALDEPVQHVSWYEADAYARWAGKRLPTEPEWERAVTHHPTSGQQRYPWGDTPPADVHANLGQRHDGPAPVGAYPRGASPWGCHQLIGDVWEWTSSDFTAYPGFRAFPYDEYSKVFFGPNYKVLRGGSWASDPVAVRGTFRNWDLPIRRQIFSGFRCARDA